MTKNHFVSLDDKKKLGINSEMFCISGVHKSLQKCTKLFQVVSEKELPTFLAGVRKRHQCR